MTLSLNRLRVALAALCLALLSCAPGLAWPAPPSALTANRPQAAAPTAAQLEALAGEYTDPNEPDTPISFYTSGGKLIVETERNIPAELKPISAVEFSLSDPNNTYRFTFTLDKAGRGASVVYFTEPEIVYQRTGPPVHHLFHDYRRTEVMIPMRDGVKLHAVILKPADIAAPLPFLIQRTPYGVDGTNRASFSYSRPELARGGYILRRRGYSRPLQKRGQVHHEPAAGRSSQPQGDRREHRRLRHRRLAAQKRPRQQRPRRFHRHQLSGLSGHDGRHRPPPGGQGHLPAGADDRRVDGRRLLPQRRLPPELRLRLCPWPGVQQGRSRGQLRQGQEKQASRRLRLLFGKRKLRRGCERIRSQDAAHLEALSQAPGL